jgi:hypothetical protein
MYIIDHHHFASLHYYQIYQKYMEDYKKYKLKLYRINVEKEYLFGSL